MSNSAKHNNPIITRLGGRTHDKLGRPISNGGRPCLFYWPIISKNLLTNPDRKRMKRTCERCKALDYRGPYDCVCTLGHKIKVQRKMLMGLVPDYRPIPTENCIKPKTYKEYLEAKKILDNLEQK